MKPTKLTREMFEKMFSHLKKETVDFLWEVYSEPHINSDDIVEYNAECSMCGKDMPHRESGMCAYCEMVWNG